MGKKFNKGNKKYTTSNEHDGNLLSAGMEWDDTSLIRAWEEADLEWKLANGSRSWQDAYRASHPDEDPAKPIDSMWHAAPTKKIEPTSNGKAAQVIFKEAAMDVPRSSAEGSQSEISMQANFESRETILQNLLDAQIAAGYWRGRLDALNLQNRKFSTPQKYDTTLNANEEDATMPDVQSELEDGEVEESTAETGAIDEADEGWGFAVPRNFQHRDVQT